MSTEPLKGIPSTMGDDYQLNTTTLLRHAVRNYPDQEIVHRRTDGSWQRTTYGENFRRIAQLANGLGSLGLGVGDAIGVLDWNSIRHFEAYWAIPAIGATMVQLNLRLAAEDLGYVVGHSNASWILVDETLLGHAQALAPSLPGVKGWIVMSDRPAGDIETTLPNVVFYEDLLAQQPDTYDWPVIDERTAYSACYTTGTTGRPKGVYYSHRAIYLHSYAISQALATTRDDVFMAITPMFHCQTWGVLQAAVLCNAAIVLPGRFQAEDIGSLGDAMIAEKVTIANGAPAIFTPVLEYFKSLPQAPDLSRARLLSGSTEPPLSLMRGFHELTGANVVHAYGATETTPLVTINMGLPAREQAKLTDEEYWDLKRNQGTPVIGIDVKIFDPGTGEEVLGDGKASGEVLFKGPWVTQSYANQPDNAERFHDGYWRSGDVGRLDANRQLKLTDRLKDVIKSGGEWISSIDMENAILDHPKVSEAAVIGVPHEKWTERPVAVVVPVAGATLTPDDIKSVLRDKFATWQLPDEIVFVQALPRTSVGKLDKKVLRTEHLEILSGR